MATIASVVFAAVGTIALYGWELGIFEATCVTILVGFSVDYTVHLAVAYNAAAGDRTARTLEA